MPGTATVHSAAIRGAAMDLLARREHTLQELLTKLRRRFDDPARLEVELRKLAAESLQSDARFAESYVRQRADRGYGPLRIRRELRERGVSDEISALAFGAAAPDWQTLASRVMLKKFGALPPVDVREQARRARFMHYRGFEAEHFLPRLTDPDPA